MVKWSLLIAVLLTISITILWIHIICIGVVKLLLYRESLGLTLVRLLCELMR